MRNAHLWKRILNEGILSPGQPQDRVNQLAHHIITQTIIVDERPWRTESFDWSSYRDLAVPFDSYWCEGRFPNEGSRWGALVRQDKDPASGSVKAEYLPHELPMTRLPGFRSIVRVLAFNAETYRGPTVFGQLLFAIDQGGSIISPEPLLYVGPELIREIGEHAASLYTRGIGFSAIELMCLLGCRNVSLAAHDNDPKEARRAAKRHGGTPESYRYHTLVVRPAGSSKEAAGTEIGSMPWHKCRGHINCYGPASIHRHPDGQDRGLLFGKYAGRFFIPPHLKGDKKNGVVEKDYAVA